MKFLSIFKLTLPALVLVFMTGCATKQVPYDYTAFKENRPKSILVLPPLNNTPDIDASNSLLAQTTYPLAEAGYYVMPVTLVAETFKENGMSQPAEMHSASAEKLREIFGADAAIYIKITKYGAVYTVINSVNLTTADARLIDLRTGKELWKGQATASSEEGKTQSQGVLGILLSAIVNQIVANVTDQSHRIAGVAAVRLLAAGSPNGILYGPRSPKFGKD